MTTYTDLQRIAYAVWRATYDEPEVSQIAIAWALRNKSHVHSGMKRSPELSFCHEILSDEVGLQKPFPAEVDIQNTPSHIWWVMANICRVWAGVVEDPTSGATAFHLHDVMPDWAIGLHPVALIGRRFFYNSPKLEPKTRRSKVTPKSTHRFQDCAGRPSIHKQHMSASRRI